MIKKKETAKKMTFEQGENTSENMDRSHENLKKTILAHGAFSLLHRIAGLSILDLLVLT